jgi:ABC-type oligopeptide transport system substrate-binding subunit
LLGILFTAGSRRRSLRGMRFMGLIVALGFSTLWLGSCGGSSTTNPSGGTTPGSYTVNVSATSSGAPTQTTTFQLVVQ